MKHISEWLKSVVLKNRDIQVREFAAYEKRKPQCPASIKEKFGDGRRIIAEDPDILKYENAQMLLIDTRKKDVQEELGIDLMKKGKQPIQPSSSRSYNLGKRKCR